MEIFKEESIQHAYRFLIASIAGYANQMSMSDEDVDVLINTVFNIMVNTLQPSYADMFVEELTSIINDVELNEYVEKQEAFDIIQSAMKGKK